MNTKPASDGGFLVELLWYSENYMSEEKKSWFDKVFKKTATEVSGLHAYGKERDEGETRFGAAISAVSEYVAPALWNLVDTAENNPRAARKSVLTAVAADMLPWIVSIITAQEAVNMTGLSENRMILVVLALKFSWNLAYNPLKNLFKIDADTNANESNTDSI